MTPLNICIIDPFLVSVQWRGFHKPCLGRHPNSMTRQISQQRLYNPAVTPPSRSCWKLMLYCSQSVVWCGVCKNSGQEGILYLSQHSSNGTHTKKIDTVVYCEFGHPLVWSSSIITFHFKGIFICLPYSVSYKKGCGKVLIMDKKLD